MSLPTGTVTFLFTDIEGSTRLWEERPEAMRRALARHDDLLRSAIERYEGHVFNRYGWRCTPETPRSGAATTSARR